MSWRDYIATDPNICHGQASIKANWIPVSVVLDNWVAILTEEEIIDSYPALTTDAIRAATTAGIVVLRPVRQDKL